MTLGKRKINDVKTKFSQAVAVALDEPSLVQSLNKECDSCERLMQLIKEKMVHSDTDQRVQMLTLVPDDWTIPQTADYFNVTQYTVRQTRKTKQEKGILSVPDVYCRTGICDETIQLIVDCYESDEVSRMCPGKKDCVTIKKTDGTKEKMQKRLLLLNISEIYSLFKSENPDVKVGISKFTMLRRKWCIPVGSSGSHNVCVCTYHQNVKLMLSAADHTLDYKDVMQLVVCDIQSEDCMLLHCDNCPDSSVLKEFLKERLQVRYTTDSTVKYKQWVSMDKSQLEEQEEEFEDFIETLFENFLQLTEHHYVSKKQSACFKERKSSLKDGEAILVSDFSENYSFVVQDAAQGLHWNNLQATIHPFVLYYYDPELNSVNKKSYACISDHMNHDTDAVFTFLKSFIDDSIKPNFPDIKKIIYFSDGSSAQYKDHENFTNLIHHAAHFEIKAEWHFFATSHGKNACDGVGGTIKRLAARASLQRPVTNQILTSKQLFDFANDEIDGITVYFVDSMLVHQISQFLKPRFSNSI